MIPIGKHCLVDILSTIMPYQQYFKSTTNLKHREMNGTKNVQKNDLYRKSPMSKQRERRKLRVQQTQAQLLLLSYTTIMPMQKRQVVIMFLRAHLQRIEVRLEHKPITRCPTVGRWPRGVNSVTSRVQRNAAKAARQTHY